MQRRSGPLVEWLKFQWLRVRIALGLASKEEVVDKLHFERESFLSEIPVEEARQELRGLFSSLDDLRTVTDLPRYLNTTAKIGKQMEMISAKYGEALGEETAYKINYIGGLDSAGWRPSGARIFQGFINPFQIFSFYAENHWSTKAAIDTIITEVISDGWSLEHDENIAPERLEEVEQIIKFLDIDNLRIGILRHYLVYGNSLVLPHYDMLKNLMKLELLIMDRCYPVQDRIYEHIVGWDYWVGYHAELYLKEQLYHLAAPSLKQPDIGIPPLACLVTDIESDLAASSLNGTVFHTAGMVGAILVMEDDPAKTGGRDMEKWGRRLQKEIQLQFSGVQGAFGLMVTNYLKEVHKLTQLNGFDAGFTKFREIVAKSVCTVLRVPPEKISINRSQGLQYQASLVEDQINKNFDKAVAGYTFVVDNHINHILRDAAKIFDVKIKANGRWGAMTINSARMSKIAAETGLPLTANQHLEFFYGLAPLPHNNPAGKVILDNSSNRDPKKLPPKFEGEKPGDYSAEEKSQARGDKGKGKKEETPGDDSDEEINDGMEK